MAAKKVAVRGCKTQEWAQKRGDPMQFGKLVVARAKRDPEFARKVLYELEKRLDEHAKQIKALSKALTAFKKIVEKQKKP